MGKGNEQGLIALVRQAIFTVLDEASPRTPGLAWDFNDDEQRVDFADRVVSFIPSEIGKVQPQERAAGSAARPQSDGNAHRAQVPSSSDKVEHEYENCPCGGRRIKGQALQSAGGDSELAARLEALGAKATPGPWAWDQRGEKVNEWGLGTAFDADEKQLAGRFTDEDAIYDEYVCSHEASTCNYTDPDLICALRNNLPAIIAALRCARSHVVRSEEK